MADLNAFFAKKKDKKKKTVVKLDDVGTLLERKVKKQEEREREEADDVKGGEEDRSQEESEWLDYETNTTNRVDGLRIKDMAVADDTEEEVGSEPAEEKEVEKESTKTWGTVEKKEPDPELIPTAADYANARPAKYVPPGQRGGGGGPAARIDLNNQEMFPTFAAAEQIEKHKKEETKSSAWTTAGAKGGDSRPAAYVPPKENAWTPARSNRDRDDAMAAARAMGATASAAVPLRPPPPSEVELRKTTNAYVPPHLRVTRDHCKLMSMKCTRS